MKANVSVRSSLPFVANAVGLGSLIVISVSFWGFPACPQISACARYKVIVDIVDTRSILYTLPLLKMCASHETLSTERPEKSMLSIPHDTLATRIQGAMSKYSVSWCAARELQHALTSQAARAWRAARRHASSRYLQYVASTDQPRARRSPSPTSTATTAYSTKNHGTRPTLLPASPPSQPGTVRVPKAERAPARSGKPPAFAA